MGAFRTAKITTKLVEALKPAETVADTLLPGYCVRRQKEARTYFVRKYVHGRRHYVGLGDHGRAGMTEARARQAALLMIAALKQGRDPTVERARQRGMPTLAAFADSFLQARNETLKKGTLAVYRYMLNKHVAPRDERDVLKPGCLGRLRLDQVTRPMLSALHRSLRTTPRAANHILDILSSLYGEAQRESLVAPGFNPASQIERFRLQPRQRYLDDVELARLGTALAEAEARSSEDPFAIAAIRLLLLTGCRRDEILDARWDWIDMQRGLLMLPDSKTGAKSVLLNFGAVEVLQKLTRVEGNPYIIVGAKAGCRFVGLRRVWIRMRERAGLMPITLADGKVQEVRLHDLRHTYASLLASGGASLPMIGALLGHARPTTTARYAHLAADPLRRLSEEAGRQALLALRKSAV